MSDSPDLLAEIDEGIARHKEVPAHFRKDNVRWACACGALFPCETLKALHMAKEAEERAEAFKYELNMVLNRQLWPTERKLQEAVVEGERHRAELESVSCTSCLDRTQAAEAKLKDAEAQVEALKKAAQEKPCALYSCTDVESLLTRVKDAEEKMRGLVEALEKARERLKNCDRGHDDRFIDGALTQAKGEGE